MKIVVDEGAGIPIRAHATDAGLDLYAVEGKMIYKGRSKCSTRAFT
jgi:dUTPase